MCLGPTGDLQGTHYFYNLDTGKQIRHSKWTEIPMPKAMVEKLIQIGEKQKAVPGLKFSDRNGNLEEHTLPDNSNIAGVCDDVFLKNEDTDTSVFDKVEENTNHRSDGDPVKTVEEDLEEQVL